MAPPPASPHVVVVGSGLAGHGVLRELRKHAPDARLTLVTHDEGHFYSKPALSTALAKGKTADTLVTIPGCKVAAQLNIDLRAGREAEAIDTAGQVLLTTGGPIAYDALVLALGADPIRPAIAGDGALRALSVNSLEQYRIFRDAVSANARVLIMGGGLVGTEFANDLSASGYRPVVVDMLEYPLAQLVPAEVGDAIRAALADKGVEWHLGRRIVAIHKDGAGIRAELDDGVTIAADVVLSAVGLRPRIQIAQDAGLDVGRGIKVDAMGCTSNAHIFAIGDCAEYLHGPSAYVTPIMAAARAIASSVLGTPTEIRFPPLSVQVKTTACPVVLLPAPVGAQGRWERDACDEAGLKYLFRDLAGTVLGYVLTHDKCQERTALDQSLSTLMTHKEPV